MNIAILTFQGFNELDSFIALGVLNRVRKPGWRVTLCCPEPEVTSMNGVAVRAQSSLEAIARTGGTAAAAGALHYVAPVGEKHEFVARAMGNITPYLPTDVQVDRATG